MSIAPPVVTPSSPSTATAPAPPTISFPEQEVATSSPATDTVPISPFPQPPVTSSPPGPRLVAPTAPEALPTPVGELAVTTDGLTRSYEGIKVVDGLNLRVPTGGVYGLLGPNGAGKSTTMRLLLGLIRPTSGHMSVLGHPVSVHRHLPPGSIGSLIEDASYYPRLSGRENLAMMASYLGLERSRVEYALDAVRMHGQENMQVRRCSMGMKRRLGLAMALLTDPPLILLDEPTNGLDPDTAAEIRQLIVSLARQRGMTVIVSSHALSEIEQMADTVGILCAGSLRYQGPLSGLDSDGVLEMVVSAPTAVSTLLTSLGMVHEVRDNVVRTAMLPDNDVGDLVTGIVTSGTTVYRVQTMRRTREQAFLELITPGRTPPPFTTAHSTPPP